MRSRKNFLFRLLVSFWLLFGFGEAAADEIRVAVASNFTQALEELADAFEQVSEHEITIIPGSTGKHYAQILHGAPFDIFLAADAARPKKLEEKNIGRHGSRFTYSIGRLALWSMDPALIDGGPGILTTGEFQHLAIANPRLAPYGRATRETLEKLGLWKTLQGRMVRGENIAQSYRYVHDCAAKLGFVAWSQLQQPGKLTPGSAWLVPAEFHAPIEQQALLLSDAHPALDFFRWLTSNQAKDTIRRHGYEVP